MYVWLVFSRYIQTGQCILVSTVYFRFNILDLDRRQRESLMHYIMYRLFIYTYKGTQHTNKI